jgi:hypothetical protein
MLLRCHPAKCSPEEIERSDRLAETNHPSPAALRASASPTRGEAKALGHLFNNTPCEGKGCFPFFTFLVSTQLNG